MGGAVTTAGAGFGAGVAVGSAGVDGGAVVEVFGGGVRVGGRDRGAAVGPGDSDSSPA